MFTPNAYIRDQVTATEVAVANNWLRWAAENYGSQHIRHLPYLLAQQIEARALIAEKCAPWFEVQL